MAEISDEDVHELGRLMGETMMCMFKVMAKIDGVPLQDAIDDWMSTYIAERIIQEATGETDAEG